MTYECSLSLSLSLRPRMPLLRLAFLYPALRHRPPSLTILRHRHGTAVEPPAQLNADPPPVPPPPPPLPKIGSDGESKGRLSRSFLDGSVAGGKELRGSVTEALLETTTGGVQQACKTIDGAAADSTTTTTTAETSGDGNSDDTTLSSPSTSSPSSSSSSSSSTFAPREYVHHFDTYSSVQQLEAGGYRRGQSVAIMKGIRALLDKNMAAARENLVSKSDIENETYLFQAACSELRNEMQNAKKAQMDQLRSERTRIQTEFDLLNQAFLAEMMTLKDELNGMFNDRKMVTRAEQRAMENKVCGRRRWEPWQWILIHRRADSRVELQDHHPDTVGTEERD